MLPEALNFVGRLLYFYEVYEVDNRNVLTTIFLMPEQVRPDLKTSSEKPPKI